MLLPFDAMALLTPPCCSATLSHRSHVDRDPDMPRALEPLPIQSGKSSLISRLPDHQSQIPPGPTCSDGLKSRHATRCSRLQAPAPKPLDSPRPLQWSFRKRTPPPFPFNPSDVLYLGWWPFPPVCTSAIPFVLMYPPRRLCNSADVKSVFCYCCHGPLPYVVIDLPGTLPRRWIPAASQATGSACPSDLMRV
jgi:hypothetical protein